MKKILQINTITVL